MPGGRDRPGVDVLADHRRRVVAHERRPACDHLVEHAAKRVQVGARRYLTSQGLFWRHVRNRAHKHPLHRQPRLVQRNCQPEVADLWRAVAIKPDIPRLEVPVYHVLSMGVHQAAAHPSSDFQCAFHRQREVQPIHRAAGHVLRDDVPLPGVVADVVNGDDMGMVAQASHRLCFPLHARDPRFVKPFRLDDGDGHIAVQLLVVRQVDPLASALAEE